MKLIHIKDCEKFLPMGSVVLLKDSIKAAMVIGYLSKNENNELKDYIAVYCPEGFIGKDKLLRFNHNDIVGVIKQGMKFEKQQEYNKFLKDEIKEYRF